MVERIELRSPRRLLCEIVGGTALVFQHGRSRYEFDLFATLAYGEPVFIERVLHPKEAEVDERESASEQ